LLLLCHPCKKHNKNNATSAPLQQLQLLARSSVAAAASGGSPVLVDRRDSPVSAEILAVLEAVAGGRLRRAGQLAGGELRRCVQVLEAGIDFTDIHFGRKLFGSILLPKFWTKFYQNATEFYVYVCVIDNRFLLNDFLKPNKVIFTSLNMTNFGNLRTKLFHKIDPRS
jgi:hypothetical protein